MSESKGGQQVGPVAQRSRRELDEETRRLREERTKDREAMREAHNECACSDGLFPDENGKPCTFCAPLLKRLESGE